MKRLATALQMFIFTINCRASQHVYTKTSNGRVARSVQKFLPNCHQKLDQVIHLAIMHYINVLLLTTELSGLE